MIHVSPRKLLRPLLLLGCTLLLPSAPASECPLPPGGPKLPEQSIRLANGQSIRVEVAATLSERRRGLMCRTQLPENNGMLLSYPEPKELRIWMKNMEIPLDILFLADDGRVLKLVEQAPPCRQDPCSIYRSDGGSSYTLELNAGAARRLGIRPGQRLSISRLRAPGDGAAPAK